MADDVLSAPLGQNIKKKRRRFTLPIRLSHLVAGALVVIVEGLPAGLSIDFDAITRDPAHPDWLRPDVDSGDGLHPSEAGYRIMGEAIPLSLFARR